MVNVYPVATRREYVKSDPSDVKPDTSKAVCGGR
jgi:hypothetical protein